jgi:hypothetical protein
VYKGPVPLQFLSIREDPGPPCFILNLLQFPQQPKNIVAIFSSP